MKTAKPYCPRGAIVPFVEAIRAEPDRVFSVAEATKLMGVRSNKVGGSLTYALRACVVYRGKVNGKVVYKGTPFPEAVKMDPPPVQKRPERTRESKGWVTRRDDIRVPRLVPGWSPPKMVCVRGV